MRIASFIPRSAALGEALTWIKDVTAVLSGGATIADQMAGQVLSFRYNSDAPPKLATRLKVAPTSVLCLSARLANGSAATWSGLPVLWEWTKEGGAILVSEIKHLDASTDYDVTLWLVGG